MSKFKIFIFNTLTTVLTSLVFRIIFLWFGVFTANKAGAENMGVYSLTMSLYNVLITIAASGLSLAASRITAEDIAKGKERNAIKNAFNCICFGIICSFAACGLIFLFCRPASQIILHGKVSTFTVKMLGLSLPFIAVSSVITGYFTALRQAYKMSLVQITENFTEIFICVYILYFYPVKDANTFCLILILGNAVSKIIAFLLHLILFTAEIRKPKPYQKASASYKRMLKIVLPVSFSSHIKSFLSGIKHTLVPLSLEKYTKSCNGALAEYGSINAMVMPVITFPCCLFGALANLLVPEIAALNIKGNKRKINHIISKTYKITMIISIFTVTALFLYGENLGVIFYKNLSVGTYITFLAPVIPFIYFDCIVDAVLKGIDLQLQVVIINISDTLICIILIYFLLPVMGIYGYIAVIYISEIFNAVMSNSVLKRKLKYKTDTTNSIIKPVVSALISALTINLLSLKGISSFSVFLFSYIFLLFTLKAIKKNEVRIILKM